MAVAGQRLQGEIVLPVWQRPAQGGFGYPFGEVDTRPVQLLQLRDGDPATV